DPDAIAAARGDAEREAQSLLDEFAKVRALGVGVIRELEPEALHLHGVHPDVGELTIANLLAEWVAHDRAHVAQLGMIVSAAMLEGLGNAAKFGHVEEVAVWLESVNRSS
ncbi:MAG: DinB family protein, partial [Chloroflexota bacterium]